MQKVTRELSDWVDRRALDNRGELVGIVVDIYDDGVAQQPAWLAIATGFFGTLVAIAPVRAASLLGDDVVIAHDRHTITAAPHVDIVVAVDPNQQQRLLDHYTQPLRPPPRPVHLDEGDVPVTSLPAPTHQLTTTKEPTHD